MSDTQPLLPSSQDKNIKNTRQKLSAKYESNRCIKIRLIIKEIFHIFLVFFIVVDLLEANGPILIIIMMMMIKTVKKNQALNFSSW